MTGISVASTTARLPTSGTVVSVASGRLDGSARTRAAACSAGSGRSVTACLRAADATLLLATETAGFEELLPQLLLLRCLPAQVFPRIVDDGKPAHEGENHRAIHEEPGHDAATRAV